MTDQRNLRRRLAELESQQDRREEAARLGHELTKQLIARKQLEIDNIKAQLTIRAIGEGKE